MAEFVLQNNFFYFTGQIKHQNLCTAIGTKCSPKYEFILLDEI